MGQRPDEGVLMSISATIPQDKVAEANDALEALGFGPGNFSVPLRSGTEGATHAGLHSWDDSSFLAALQGLDITGLEITVGVTVETEDGPVQINDNLAPNFDYHAASKALEWEGVDQWFVNPIMTGDQRTFNGKLWVSLIDYNVWEPPIGWREIVAEGYPEWVQPTGSHDAYNIGDRVSFQGSDYESIINANVWSPTAYPAGWTLI